MRIHWLLLLLFALMILLSCSDNTTGPTEKQGAIPLAIGNSWTYKHTWIGNFTKTATSKIVSTQKIQPDPSIQSEATAYLTDDSLAFYNHLSKTYYGKYKIKQFFEIELTGLFPHDLYNYSDKIETITVPAGTFQAYKFNVLSVAGDIMYTYYLADGVGIVKYQEFTYPKQDWFHTVELTSYSVK